ncbi:hypothetical protein FRC03_002732 [Tulasnella sp. 419]|nr:hypothetical protein FRC03_002732 [Tulasnella sp. 419]
MVKPRGINQKNMWIAAGDGDLPRVMELVSEGLSPNVPDENTYTPMHAAASYGHLDVLDYLITQGGDVNVLDEDGETPLFVVESIDVAKFLVERGAKVDLANKEGMTAADNLDEEFPEVANYLRSINGDAAGQNNENPFSSENQPVRQAPSQHYTNMASEMMTNELLEKVAEVVENARKEGREDGPSEEELRRVVQGHLINAVRTGQRLSEQMENGGGNTSSDRVMEDDVNSKRIRRGD